MFIDATKARKDNAVRKELAGDYYDGKQLIVLFSANDFDPRMARQFRTTINMVKHMNAKLFMKGETKVNIGMMTLREIEGLSVQVYGYFRKTEDYLDGEIDKLEAMKNNLPTLDSKTDPRHVQSLLKIWAEKINGQLMFPRTCEKALYEGFAEFWDAQIYNSFLQVREKDDKHEMIKLGNQFKGITERLEDINERYSYYAETVGSFGAVMNLAKRCLLDSPAVYMKQCKVERMYKGNEEKSGSLKPGIPSAEASAYLHSIAGQKEKEPLDSAGDLENVINSLKDDLKLDNKEINKLDRLSGA